MLRNTKDIQNYLIGSTDGEIGPGFWTDDPAIPESSH